MEANLRKALNKGEFIIYYQPQAYSTSGKLAGLEALVRWNDPKAGLIFPADFIPLAEETGLIIDIDRYVMQIAMKQISIWYKKGFNPGILALNLSMKQLDKDDFIDILKDCMNKNKFNPKWLELEISEGEVMRNPEKSIVKLKEISRMGIEIAIDDFGTGYSSLSYLKKLPVDTLKIDQSFVRGLPEDKEDVSIVKAIIALANSFNLNMIAEGVETKAQKDFMEKNGCNYIQGYYYGKPMSALDIENRYLPETIE
jgi:EAL domain-containing protein (putative c-di-GMP-specific phosphodiesterase class I)